MFHYGKCIISESLCALRLNLSTKSFAIYASPPVSNFLVLCTPSSASLAEKYFPHSIDGTPCVTQSTLADKYGP